MLIINEFFVHLRVVSGPFSLCITLNYVYNINYYTCIYVYIYIYEIIFRGCFKVASTSSLACRTPGCCLLSPILFIPRLFSRSERFPSYKWWLIMAVYHEIFHGIWLWWDIVWEYWLDLLGYKFLQTQTKYILIITNTNTTCWEYVHSMF